MAESGQKSEIRLTDAVKRVAKEQNLKIKPTIDAFLGVLKEQYGDKFRLNVMTGKQEYLENDGKWHEWTDGMDSYLRQWFQATMWLYNNNMLDDALKIFMNEHKVNPLIDKLESLEWDGVERIGQFLHFAAKCPDDAYHREVSRLIFAGGVWRAYRPGCKFDDMVVLIGKQGGGKSALVRWLNMDDAYFREIKTISGKEGIEIIRGAWIAEVAELMAMTRVKETEAVKAYITSQEDTYRQPYAKHVQTIPRRCVFIGTTNNPQFLTDRTGNRRFYPVNTDRDGYDLFDHEEEIRAYIEKCWAEAVHKFKHGDMKPYATRELIEIIRAAQENAMEDDWRIGAIEQYLEDTKKKPNDYVSVIELWYNALGMPSESKPTRKDSIEIGQIMVQIGGWIRYEKPIRTAWGHQKVFRKDQKFYPFWR